MHDPKRAEATFRRCKDRWARLVHHTSPGALPGWGHLPKGTRGGDVTHAAASGEGAEDDTDSDDE